MWQKIRGQSVAGAMRMNGTLLPRDVLTGHWGAVDLKDIGMRIALCPSCSGDTELFASRWNRRVGDRQCVSTLLPFIHLIVSELKYYQRKFVLRLADLLNTLARWA